MVTEKPTRVRSHRRALALVLGLILAWADPVLAHRFPLFDQDHAAREPNSGLVWLDLGFTSNHTFGDNWSGFLTAAEPFVGYRYASASNVFGLFTDAESKYLITHGSDPSINYLVDLLQPRFREKHETIQDGEGGRDTDNITYLNNWLLGGGSGDGMGFSSGGGGASPHNDTQIIANDDPPPPVTPTPLPGSLPLLGITLGCLGLLGWQRQRRVASQLPN
jgi:hypothetical protein